MAQTSGSKKRREREERADPVHSCCASARRSEEMMDASEAHRTGSNDRSMPLLQLQNPRCKSWVPKSDQTGRKRNGARQAKKKCDARVVSVMIRLPRKA